MTQVEQKDSKEITHGKSKLGPRLNLRPKKYSDLNSRQKENYNFQKVSAVLADYDFKTMRLSDDWRGADFIAYHNDGEQFLKVQLKTRLCFDTKYKDKGIWICFHDRDTDTWYLYPHDATLRWALANTNIGRTKDWKDWSDWAKVTGAYTYPGRPPKKYLPWLAKYVVPER